MSQLSVIEIAQLSKEYRRFRRGTAMALGGLDLSVPAGGVFGFLGPNGSGKTTTIRCLLGLVRPTRGRLHLLGAEVGTGLPDVLPRVGSLVETPTFFPNFSARRNLTLLGRLAGIGPAAVDDVLERVGLAESARDSVRTYSLGMKQRLGIAAALLKDPEVLILDEPANGLDPAGIKEIRQLLRRLGQEGRTVFVSSHILSEVRQTCDRVAILTRGRCVASGAVDEVLRSRRAEALLVKVPDLLAGRDSLGRAGIAAAIAGDSLRVALPAADAGRVTEVLAGDGIYLTELRPEEASLEDVFLELTGEQIEEQR